MLIETGKIVAVEDDGLWVETIARSTCGSCAAEKGCGQSLMAKWTGHTSYLWVSLAGRDSSWYQVGASVRLGIPEQVVANGSLLVYLLPLLAMLGATVVAGAMNAGEGVSILAGLSGLIAGGALVRWHAHLTRHDSRLQPVLVDEPVAVTLA